MSRGLICRTLGLGEPAITAVPRCRRADSQGGSVSAAIGLWGKRFDRSQAAGGRFGTDQILARGRKPALLRRFGDR